MNIQGLNLIVIYQPLVSPAYLVVNVLWMVGRPIIAITYIIDLVSHSTYVVCVNLGGGTYSLKSTLHDRFFEKLFMAIIFITQRFCWKSAERKSPKKYFLYFVLKSCHEVKPWLYVQ